MTLAVQEPEWGAGDIDEVIVGRTSASDTEALDLLYRSYAARIRRLCRARLKNKADAEDACQETLLRAHQALTRFREGAPMWPWLATIAGNVCIDMHRARRTDSLDAGILDNEISLDDPHTEVMERLRRDLVNDTLEALPHRYRSPIYLRDMEGWSYDDIAELEGTTVTTVRGTLHRGRIALRARLEERAKASGLWPLAGGLAWLPRLRFRTRRTPRPAGRHRLVLASAGDFSSLLGPLLPSMTQVVGVTLAFASAAMPSLMGLAGASEPTGISAANVTEFVQDGRGGAGDSTSSGSTGATGSRVAIHVDDKLAPPTPGGAATTADAGLDGQEKRVLQATVTVTMPDGQRVKSTAATDVRCDLSPEREAICHGVDQVASSP